MAMAGGMFQTFTFPRASCISIATLAPIGISPVAVCRRSVELPDVKGLKIQSNSRSRNLQSLSRRTVGRAAGSIVCEAPQETAVIVPAITDGDWEKLVLGSDTTVLVEFWAPWCGPCRIIHPVIDELAKEYGGKQLKCFKVNTDGSPSIATRYGIRSIPTVILFKNGEKKDAIIGAVPKSTLTTSIEKLL